MTQEKYIVDIGKEGSQGLGKLDYLFNPTTQAFLLQAGLKSGMRVLDIGCGSGIMTCWMANQVGADGLVVGIENDMNQLQAAEKNAKNLSAHNTKFKFCSAYEIETLNEQFDLVYCRFVMHHLQNPISVIAKIYQILNKNGVYAAEEGIVNYAFSYPFSTAWGDESKRLPTVWIDASKDQRDPNIGAKMFTKMYQAGFKIHDTKIIHPVLTTRNEKQLLLLGIDETKNFYLSESHTEQDWMNLIKETEAIINNDAQIAGFYASCQVSGIKI